MFIDGCLLVPALLLGALLGYSLRSRAVATELNKLPFLPSRNLYMYGWHSDLGRYQLQSFDGGETWYTTDCQSRSLTQANLNDRDHMQLDSPGQASAGSNQPRSLVTARERVLASKQGRCMRLQPISQEGS